VHQLSKSNYKVKEVKSAEITHDSILKVDFLEKKALGFTKGRYFELDLNQVLSADNEINFYPEGSDSPENGRNYYKISADTDSAIYVELHSSALKKQASAIDLNSRTKVKIVTKKQLMVELETSRKVIIDNGKYTYSEEPETIYQDVNQIYINLPQKDIHAYKALYLVSVPIDIALSPIWIVVYAGVGVVYLVRNKLGRQKDYPEEEIIKED